MKEKTNIHQLSIYYSFSFPGGSPSDPTPWSIKKNSCRERHEVLQVQILSLNQNKDFQAKFVDSSRNEDEVPNPEEQIETSETDLKKKGVNINENLLRWRNLSSSVHNVFKICKYLL